MQLWSNSCNVLVCITIDTLTIYKARAAGLQPRARFQEGTWPLSPFDGCHNLPTED